MNHMYYIDKNNNIQPVGGQSGQTGTSSSADYVIDTIAEAQQAIADGLIKEGTTVYVKEGTNDAIGIASSDKVGLVKPDGESITIDEDGTLHSSGSSSVSIDIDDALSDTSVNPVQNKVIKEALDSKAESNHTHNEITELGTEVDNIKIELSNKSESDHTHSEFGIALIGTLTAGQTNITLQNESISTNSTIEIYTSVYGVNPTDVIVSDGSISLTFKSQSQDVSVKVVVK